MSQLPAEAQERAQARESRLSPAQAPLATMDALPPQARTAGSVDPDEIARLLDRGEAASIDAAAAIASGVAAQREPAASSEDERTPRRNGVELAVPGGS